MRATALISRKGGAGKTTLAINLAVAVQRAGIETLVVDLDPQASATAWADSRDAGTPLVLSAHAARLPEILSTARQHGAALCLIDTVPHAEGPALAAGLALIPRRPSIIGHGASPPGPPGKGVGVHGISVRATRKPK